MAKKNETRQQAAAADSQPQTQSPQYRYNESMINWEQLKNFGISREYLQERGLLEQMYRGYKTNQVVPISMNFGSGRTEDGRTSVLPAVHGGRSGTRHPQVSGRSPTLTDRTSDISSPTRTRRTCSKRATWDVSWN